MSCNRRVVFIDRDGVINHDSPHYIKSEDEFVFIDGSTEAFGLLEKHGFATVIITNQSVIGRKLVTAEGLERIFEKMRAGIYRAGGMVLDILFCPHLPEDRCGCRKPEPGLLNMAKERHSIDMKESFMIGDSSKDLAAAERAGVGGKILVRTGNGEKTLSKIRAGEIPSPDYVAASLLDAAEWIVSSAAGCK